MARGRSSALPAIVNPNSRRETLDVVLFVIVVLARIRGCYMRCPTFATHAGAWGRNQRRPSRCVLKTSVYVFSRSSSKPVIVSFMDAVTRDCHAVGPSRPVCRGIERRNKLDSVSGRARTLL